MSGTHRILTNTHVIKQAFAKRARQLPATLAMLAMLAFALLSLTVYTLAQAQPSNLVIAEVTVVIGKARLQQSGQWRNVKAGDHIIEEARLETEADGYVYIKTVDQGFISLRPNSALSFETYRYDPQNPSATTIKLTLHKGVMRSVSGVGAQNARDKFRLNTPVAAIGIRGTDFSTFTDDKTTLVSVRSGGVVASPFDGACQPTGTGPCGGEHALDLMAGRPNLVLQVSQGTLKPQLLERSPQDRTPDNIAPPLPGEGSSQGTSQGTSKSQAPASLSLAEITAAGGITATAPIVPKIYWGRWQYLADLPPTEALEAFVTRVAQDPSIIKRPYAMARGHDPEFQIPSSGSFNFALRAYEAYIVDNATQKAAAASVSNAVLNIDFSRQQFSTSLDLKAGNNTVNISGVGAITPNGMLEGDRMNSNASIDGMLAGAGAKQAGYVFNKPTEANGLSAVGATFWAR